MSKYYAIRLWKCFQIPYLNFPSSVSMVNELLHNKCISKAYTRNTTFPCGNVFICLLTRLEKKISKHHSDNIFLLNFKTIFSLSIYVFLKIHFRNIFLVLQDTKSKLRFHFSMEEWSFLALQIDLIIRNNLPKGGFDIVYSINLLLYHSVRYI